MDTIINNLPLPEELTVAIANQVWQTPEDPADWNTLFTHGEIDQPTLYSLQGMQGETTWLKTAGAAYHGNTNEGFVPGDIDPNRTIVIGDLGPDRLIALDFRESVSRPTVVALTSTEHSCWVIVANDIASFMKAIRLKE